MNARSHMLVTMASQHKWHATIYPKTTAQNKGARTLVAPCMAAFSYLHINSTFPCVLALGLRYTIVPLLRSPQV